MSDFGFEVTATLPDGRGRAGTIHTPHGTINTPAFVAVGTKATVKAVLPEAVRDRIAGELEDLRQLFAETVAAGRGAPATTRSRKRGSCSGRTLRNWMSTSGTFTVVTGRPPFCTAGKTMPRLAK